MFGSYINKVYDMQNFLLLLLAKIQAEFTFYNTYLPITMQSLTHSFQIDWDKTYRSERILFRMNSASMPEPMWILESRQKVCILENEISEWVHVQLNLCIMLCLDGVDQQGPGINSEHRHQQTSVAPPKYLAGELQS